MAHFVPADFATKCDECGEPIPVDALVMHTEVRSPTLLFHHYNRRRVVYCEACGKLYLESQWKSGSLSK
jgi:uncharacterized protein with PIN domain